MTLVTDPADLSRIGVTTTEKYLIAFFSFSQKMTFSEF